jgi:hypothetical protein
VDFTKCSICRCVLAQRQRANWPVTSRPSPLHLQQLAELDTDGRGVEAWGRRGGATAHRDLELGLPDRAAHAIQMSRSACGAMAEELSPPDPGLRAMEPWRSDRRGACRTVQNHPSHGPAPARPHRRSCRSEVGWRVDRDAIGLEVAELGATPVQPDPRQGPLCQLVVNRAQAPTGPKLQGGTPSKAPASAGVGQRGHPAQPAAQRRPSQTRRFRLQLEARESDSHHVDQGTRPMLSRPARRASVPREDGSPKPETELTIGLARKGTAPT